MSSANYKQRSQANYQEAERDAAFYPGFGPNPANQNFWSSYNSESPKFIGSLSFWSGLGVTALTAGAGFAALTTPGLVAGGPISELGQGFTNLSLFIQPMLLLILIWVVAFTTHRARVQNTAIFQLIRAANKLFTPTDRAVSEINNLQDAVTASLAIIERKISDVADEGEQLAQKFNAVLQEINQASDGNIHNIKDMIGEAEEQRQFLQHANLMITTEANYELERNSSNVKRVLQMLKSEIEGFMVRLTRDTTMMSEMAAISATETEMVKIITEDLRTIVNSSYRTIQSAVDEGRESFRTTLLEIEQESRNHLLMTGDTIQKQLQETATAFMEQFDHATKKLEQTLEGSSRSILEAITQRAKVSAMSIEATTLDANDLAIQKVENTIATMQDRIAGVMDNATREMSVRMEGLLAQIEEQRAKAVTQISEKMVEMPKSMRSAAKEAIQLIQKTAEETSSAISDASRLIVDGAVNAVSGMDHRTEVLEKTSEKLEAQINQFDRSIQTSLAATSAGVRATGEDIRETIAIIKSEYVGVLNDTLAKLSSFSKPEVKKAPEVVKRAPKPAHAEEPEEEPQESSQAEDGSAQLPTS
jgi:archaellum component FlaC